jgi:hypothetical protein
MSELEQAILANESEPSRLKRVSCNIHVAKDAVEQIIAEAQRDASFHQEEEMQIHFHRYQLPPLLAKWIFFQKCYALECILLASTGEKRNALLAEQQQQTKDFFVAYKGFIQYYLSKDQKLDKDLFTIHSTVRHQLMQNEEELPANLNPGCLLASYLLAYHEFARLLLTEMNGPEAEPADPLFEKMNYTGKIIDIIELGMLLWISRAFRINGKPATEKQVFERLEMAIDLPVGNISQRISELKHRKEPLEKVKAWTKMANDHLGKLAEDRPRRK